MQKVLFLFLFPSLVFAQKKEVKTVKDHKDAIVLVGNWTKNILKDNYYKDYSFKHNDTGKVIKFADLDVFQKKMFVLFQLEKLTQTMEYLDEQWNKELDALPKDAPDEKAAKETDPPKKGDLEEALVELKKVRVDAAKKMEDFAVEFFKEHKTNFTQKEIDQYLKTIRDYAKNNKLIP